jgi:Bap31/Bap29 transmembrane region
MRQVNTRWHNEPNRVGLSPNEKTQMLADKWRQERNFWIATMCLLLWVVLSRFYVLAKHNLVLRDQVRADMRLRVAFMVLFHARL